jgi:hypothetical protein
MTSCPRALIFLPQEVLPTPLSFLIALPWSCSGVGGHRGQETACLVGARQTGWDWESPPPFPFQVQSPLHLFSVSL